MDVYNGLLFRGFKFDVNSGDEFRWHTQSQDVGRYIGHRAHIEIIDHGDGFVAVDEIRFSDHGPPQPEPNSVAQRVLSTKEVDSLEIACQSSYEKKLARSFQSWARGSGDAGRIGFCELGRQPRASASRRQNSRTIRELTKSYADISSKVPLTDARLGNHRRHRARFEHLYSRKSSHQGEVATRGNLTAFGPFPKLLLTTEVGGW